MSIDFMARGIAKKALDEISKGGGGDTKTVKVSSTDTTDDFLLNKIAVEANKLKITKLDSGANEQIQLTIDDNTMNKINFRFGRTYYVTSNGDDTNGDGSVGNPFATIQKAMDIASNGNTIRVENGTYPAFNITKSVFINCGNTNEVQISGDVTVTAVSNVYTVIAGMQINGKFTTNGIGGIRFIRSRFIPTTGRTANAINISGALTNNITFDNCYVVGTAIIAVTNANEIQFNTGYYDMDVTLTSGIMMASRCINMGTITHSSGILYLNGIDNITKDSNGNCIKSTANMSASNLLVINDVNTYALDLTQGKINQTGTGYYVVGSYTRNTNDVFAGTRLNYTRFATDIQAVLNPVNYTKVDNSIEGHLKGIDNFLATGSGKIKVTSGDTADYLGNKIDSTTLVVNNNKIMVQSINGLTSTIAELNYVHGVTGDIQTQINNLSNAISFKGSVATKSALNAITGMVNGDAYIVNADESSGGAKDWYLYTASGWTLMGITSVTVRDFSTNPINLATEVTGTLPQANMNLTGIAKTTDLSSYLDKTTYDSDANGKVDDSDKLGGQLPSYYAKESELGNKVDKITDKGLSTNDYTTAEQSKVALLTITGDGTKYLADDGTYKTITSSNPTGNQLGFSGATTARLALLNNTDLNTKEFLFLDTDLHTLMLYKPSCTSYIQYKGQVVDTVAPTNPIDGQIWNSEEIVYVWDNTNKYWKVKLSNFIRKHDPEQGSYSTTVLDGAELRVHRDTSDNMWISIYQNNGMDTVLYSLNDADPTKSVIPANGEVIIVPSNISADTPYSLSAELVHEGYGEAVNLIRYGNIIYVTAYTKLIVGDTSFTSMTTAERLLYLTDTNKIQKRFVYDTDLGILMQYIPNAGHIGSFVEFSGQAESGSFPYSNLTDGQVYVSNDKTYKYNQTSEYWSYNNNNVYYFDTWDKFISAISVTGTTYVGKYAFVINANGGNGSSTTYTKGDTIPEPITDSGSAIYYVNAQGSLYSVTCQRRQIVNPILISVLTSADSGLPNIPGYHTTDSTYTGILPTHANKGDILYFDGSTWSIFQSYINADSIIMVGGTPSNQTLWKKQGGTWVSTNDFVGTPTAPTASADTATKQIASTEFVIGQAGNSTPNMNGTAATGISKKYSREDHVHPSDTSKVSVSQIGIANGIVPLNANGKIDLQYLTISGSKIIGVSDATARLALSAYDGFMVAVQADTKIAYGINANLDPAVSTNWISMGDISSQVQSVNGKTGVIVLTKTDVGLGNVDNTADVDKNVLSATKLTTPRNINGVAFDGTGDITVTDDSKVPTSRTVNGHDLSQDLNITKTDVGLGSVNNTADAEKNVLSATKLLTARKINGVAFDGTVDITVVSKPSYLVAYNGNNQTLTGVGNIVSFANIESSSGTDITLSNNCFLLKGGNVCTMTAVFGLMNFSTAGWIQFRWRTGQVSGSGTWLGNTAEIDACSATYNSCGGTSTAMAIYAPVVDTYVHLEIVSGSSYTTINPMTYAFIKVLH